MEQDWTPRVRTDPALKWLLNERAALAGRICELDDTASVLADRLTAAQQRVHRLTAKMAEAQAMRHDATAKLQALDAVMEAQYRTVNPASAGVVHARAGRYGARGGLKRYALSVVKSASPAPISTGELARLSATHFGLQIPTSEAGVAFRKQIRRLLRSAFHLVEELPAQTRKGAIGWRWRGMPSLASLAQEAQRHELGPQADAAGREVGG